MKVKVDTSIDPQQLFQSLESSRRGPFKGAGYPLLALPCAAPSAIRAAPCILSIDIRYSRCPVQRCPLFALLRALLSVSRAGTRAPLSVFRAAPTDQSSIIIPIIREFGSNHQQQSLESCKSII